jgi:hypothetical protein
MALFSFTALVFAKPSVFLETKYLLKNKLSVGSQHLECASPDPDFLSCQGTFAPSHVTGRPAHIPKLSPETPIMRFLCFSR